MKRHLLALTLAATTFACANRFVQGPSDTLRSYADALADGRADDAYQLLSDDAKRQISVEAFRRIVRESRDDVLDIARALGRSGSDPVVTAVVHAPSGDALTLVYEGGRWRVDGTGIDRYGQATPRQALIGFLRAYERGRYDILVRFMPDTEREAHLATLDSTPAAGGTPGAPAGSETPPTSATAQADPLERATEDLKRAWEGPQKERISKTVQAIKTAMPTAKIEQTEDRAAMAYGAGGTVLFVREQGLWKIEDLR